MSQPIDLIVEDRREADALRATLTPLRFWEKYREELRKKASSEAYQSSPGWTQVAIPAATKACEALELEVYREYFLLDVGGYKSHRDGKRFGWRLHVALEHENANWRVELCKLAFIVADLRVLVGYHKYTADGPDPRGELQEAVDRLDDRVMRVPNSEWLFVLGPRSNDLKHPFMPFTLNADGKVVPIDDDVPLIPSEFR